MNNLNNIFTKWTISKRKRWEKTKKIIKSINSLDKNFYWLKLKYVWEEKKLYLDMLEYVMLNMKITRKDFNRNQPKWWKCSILHSKKLDRESKMFLFYFKMMIVSLPDVDILYNNVIIILIRQKIILVWNKHHVTWFYPFYWQSFYIQNFRSNGVIRPK